MAEKMALRDAYGQVLKELGAENPAIVVLDADLSGSTKTAVFAKAFPDRFFNMGVAAQLAACGKIPFVSTFAIFAAGRAFEQVRNTIAYPGLNVKIVATHAGVGVGEDGGSHQAIEDVALMRVLPNMTVLVPADAVEARQAVRTAASWDGPVYIRMGRSAVPILFDHTYTFMIGRAKLLRRPLEGPAHVALIANGALVAESLTAASQLAERGIEALVLNCSSVKPLDQEAVLAVAREAGAVVVAEEHSVIGGLGSAVAETLGQAYPVPLALIGVQDQFGQSGSPADLMTYYRLTVADIVEKAAQLALIRRNP